MITRFRKITIIKHRAPEKGINKEIQWFSNSLGLLSLRDKDSSCFRLFLEILKTKKPLSSDELAYKLNLSRATVIHHLNKLISSGMVVVQDNKYSLRSKNLETTLKKMKADFLSAYEEIEDVAKDIDKKLGL
jgi:predicted transcriptional regulator